MDTVTFGREQIQIRCGNLVTLSSVPNLAALLDDIETSAIPKPKPGWGSQDRARISMLDRELTAQELQQAYQQTAQETAALEGGCSGTTLLITPKKIHVAWLGDTPAFLVGIDPASGQAVQVKGLNEPHIPIREAERIEKKGGRVVDGRLDKPGATEMSLSMSRAFGNAWLGELLNREPEVLTVERAELDPNLDWVAVVGSDGIIADSEHNLLFPRKDGRPIIDHVASLFQELIAEIWQSPNRAEVITAKAQAVLQQLYDQTPEPRRFDDAVVDDTTLVIVPLQKMNADIFSCVVTVADGHRDGGEVTAERVAELIHAKLATR
ncbi:MAG TPA: hypothetical protein V6C99_06435 [Oculatellaceae cyanobacterium]|jgi:serine/threonine protein phosphatase PrpC